MEIKGKPSNTDEVQGNSAPERSKKLKADEPLAEKDEKNRQRKIYIGS